MEVAAVDQGDPHGLACQLERRGEPPEPAADDHDLMRTSRARVRPASRGVRLRHFERAPRGLGSGDQPVTGSTLSGTSLQVWLLPHLEHLKSIDAISWGICELVVIKTDGCRRLLSGTCGAQDGDDDRAGEREQDQEREGGGPHG